MPMEQQTLFDDTSPRCTQTPTRTTTPRYVYKTTLKTVYGLTDGLIAKLGEPDKRVPNPHYRKAGAPSALYLVERVEQFIDTHAAELAHVRALRAKRSAAMTAVMQRRREAAEAWARTVPLQIAPLPRLHTLAGDVHDYYAAISGEHRSHIHDNGYIAYIRHNYTNYDAVLIELEQRPDQVGSDAAYVIIRERIDALSHEALAKLKG
jgi:hypothetical protein